MEPLNKKVKLSLERPWKDDSGTSLPVLLDIGPDGEQIYEPKQSANEVLSEHLQRIFLERGSDFFDTYPNHLNKENDSEEPPEDSEDKPEPTTQIMTPEALFKMRTESIPHIFTALGEMEQAMQLATSLLKAVPQSSQSSVPSALQQLIGVQPLPVISVEESDAPANFSATIVKKQAPIPSVAAFNGQLNLGAKDQSLRRAANIFKAAAVGMESSRIKNESYWLDALKLRRANWGLMPAPFPHNTSGVKGSDKLAKDFLISFGLEESPPIFKQRAVAQMPEYGGNDQLNFRSRSNSRLRVSIISKHPDTDRVLSQNHVASLEQENLDSDLRHAQREIVDEELFSALVREAGTLPTASTRVSERLVAVEVSEQLELQFELIEDDLIRQRETHGPLGNQCEIIYHSLHALLLRLHSSRKQTRLGLLETNQKSGVLSSESPFLILRPITDLLQYQLFCDRVFKELDSTITTLRGSGISCHLRFSPVGELGQQIVSLADEEEKSLGGEAVLRVDNRHTLRFTLSSPSTLIAHLPQATMTIGSMPLLIQLVRDEMELCLLRRICEIGSELCEHIEGTWFVDLNQCMGRWEGCVLNFKMHFKHQESLECTAFIMDHTKQHNSKFETYGLHHKEESVLVWVERTIRMAMKEGIQK